MIKDIHNASNVSYIYVFCRNIAHHSQWSKGYNKIYCVEDKIETLMSKINECVIKWQRESSSLRVNLPAFAPIFNVLDTSDMNYRHYYLKGFLNFEHRIQSKLDLLLLSKAIYKNKQNMNTFMKDYYIHDMKKVIYWYTKESFLYKIVNNCLKVATPSSIQYCLMILKDLEKAIKERYQQKSKDYSGRLYRVTYISGDEWDTLKNNIGRDIEMYGFLSTSKAKAAALNFIKKDANKKGFITIIVPGFPDKGEQGFAGIKDLSAIPNEDEVLLNVRSQFKILEATVEEVAPGITCRHLGLVYGMQAMRRYLKLYQPNLKMHIVGGRYRQGEVLYLQNSFKGRGNLFSSI